MLVASIAFVGVGIYTVIGGWHMLGAAVGSPHRPTRREMLARIPRPIRKLGIISITIFIGCLLMGIVISLFSR